MLASVDAAIAVLLVDEPAICNQNAVDLAARSGVDFESLAQGGSQIYRADGITAVARRDQATSRAFRGEEFSGVTEWIGVSSDHKAMVSSARHLTSDDGRHLGSVLASWDATELIGAIRVREEFLTTVSHELRTPLTSIMGYLEMLEDLDAMPMAQAQRVLTIASRNCVLLLDRITQLLDASGDADRMHRARRSDVSGLVSLALTKHEVGARTLGVGLELRLTPDVVAELTPRGSSR